MSTTIDKVAETSKREVDHKTSNLNVGILTGGGLAPGTNAVIAGIALLLKKMGHRALGIPRGWKGLTETGHPLDFTDWSEQRLRQLPTLPGTILRSSREKVDDDNIQKVLEEIQHHSLDAIVAIGGDDTLGSANFVRKHGFDQIVGVPKTIDNDVHGTNLTYGHMSAADVAAKHVEMMRIEARDMVRVAIVEIMGRDAGWLAMRGGAAGGADIELIPEVPIEMDRLLTRIEQLFKQQENVVIAIAEGYPLQEQEVYQSQVTDPSGHKRLGGVGRKLANIIEQELKPITAQVQVPGYRVRGETNAFDRIFGRGLGALAANLVHERNFGKMAALSNGEVVPVPLEQAKGGRNVPKELYDKEAMQMSLLARERMKAVLL